MRSGIAGCRQDIRQKRRGGSGLRRSAAGTSCSAGGSGRRGACRPRGRQGDVLSRQQSCARWCLPRSPSDAPGRARRSIAPGRPRPPAGSSSARRRCRPAESCAAHRPRRTRWRARACRRGSGAWRRLRAIARGRHLHERGATRAAWPPRAYGVSASGSLKGGGEVHEGPWHRRPMMPVERRRTIKVFWARYAVLQLRRCGQSVRVSTTLGTS